LNDFIFGLYEARVGCESTLVTRTDVP